MRHAIAVSECVSGMRKRLGMRERLGELRCAMRDARRAMRDAMRAMRDAKRDAKRSAMCVALADLKRVGTNVTLSV